MKKKGTLAPAKWMEAYDVVTEEEKDVVTKSDFADLFEKSTMNNFSEGELFKGTVVGISKDYVMVDIGYKQEGLVSIKEFINYDGALTVKVGDQIEVFLEKLESGMGNLLLSKDKAEILKAWDKISAACDSGESVEGLILSKVKGGFSVDIGVKAFLPGSQIDLRPVRNLDNYLGKRMKFKVIKFNKKRGNIVLSHKAILQEVRGKMRSEILGQIEEGMVVKGVVKNITDYGAFIDLGGIDGLLHITDMSWGRVKHPSAILNVGDEIDVKVLKFDSDKERVSLGIKQVLANPWDSVEERYAVGAEVEGEIVSLKDYGIFLELDDGIEGLVHISEISWSNKNVNPTKLFNVGERIRAKVLAIDSEEKRISLGIKQLLPNPWSTIESKYFVGNKVHGKVKFIADFGLFIDLGEEIDALIHISDISWTRKNINLNKMFKEGDEVDAVVLIVDQENKKFCLGIKQLEEDPWKRIEERIPIGSVIEVPVTKITDFGVFTEVETGIEGLVHISELSEDRVEKPEEFVKVGDVRKAMVISIDKESKKIALSFKSALNAEVQNYRQESSEFSAIADKLKGISID